MRFTDLVPVSDVCDEDAGANNIFHAGPSFLESRLDVLERLHRLRVGIANADHLPIRRSGRRAGYMNLCTHAYCARVTHDRFPRGAAGDVLALHEILHFADDCNGAQKFWQPSGECASNLKDETLYSALRSKLSRHGACATYKSYLPSR